MRHINGAFDHYLNWSNAFIVENVKAGCVWGTQAYQNTLDNNEDPVFLPPYLFANIDVIYLTTIWLYKGAKNPFMIVIIQLIIVSSARGTPFFTKTRPRGSWR